MRPNWGLSRGSCRLEHNQSHSLFLLLITLLVESGLTIVQSCHCHPARPSVFEAEHNALWFMAAPRRLFPEGPGAVGDKQRHRPNSPPRDTHIFGRALYGWR
jgi:hypothetical protein